MFNREVSQQGGSEEHGQPKQDNSGHAAAKSRAFLLWRGGQFRLPLWALWQRQWLLRYQAIKAFYILQPISLELFIFFVLKVPILSKDTKVILSYIKLFYSYMDLYEVVQIERYFCFPYIVNVFPKCFFSLLTKQSDKLAEQHVEAWIKELTYIRPALVCLRK